MNKANNDPEAKIIIRWTEIPCADCCRFKFKPYEHRNK